ncbi:MAG: bile acid:sodium symporter family protein [Cytophagales bacterium]|nr:bile acid:sodium symporter family protein [Cytophagales bacterium]
MKNLQKSLLILGAVLLLIGILDQWEGLTGIAVILGFVMLAIGIRVSDFAKGFTYTVLILASVSMAMFYPQFFIRVGSFELKGLIIPLLQIIMFGMGSQMSLKDFRGVIMAPKAVLIGVLCQFTIMPLVALLLISFFRFPPEIAAGIVLVGTSPSGLASNVMSFLSKANVALSVTLTAVATVLAPLLTPFLMHLIAGELVPVDFWNMMLGIMNMVILPIIAGLIFNLFAFSETGTKGRLVQMVAFSLVILTKSLITLLTQDMAFAVLLTNTLIDIVWFVVIPVISGMVFLKLFGQNRDLMEKILSLVSMIAIGLIITVITAAGRDNLLDIGLLLILACVIHNLMGYGLGYGICKLLGVDEASCRTIAFEVGMQNSGLASGIALQMGKVATIGLAPSVFGPLMNITGSSLATWWRGKPVASSTGK